MRISQSITKNEYDDSSNCIICRYYVIECWKNERDQWRFATLGSFAQGGESGEEEHVNNLGHGYNNISGGEMKSEVTSLWSFKVSADNTINISGRIITLGSGYAAGTTVTVMATDYLCRKCFWGETWCGSCNSQEDNKNILPCS